MRTVVLNIHTLIIDEGKEQYLMGREMSRLSTLSDAFLIVDDGRISDYGTMDCWKSLEQHADVTVDANGGMVLPSWCDPHTHIVYAGSREGEFVDKIRGLSYEEIARRGGGILNSADRLHSASEEKLFRDASQRAYEMISKGTGCIEVKSGYGLNTADELKMLRVIRRMKEELPVRIVSTFLGAHAVARGMNKEAYVDLVINEMIPEVGREDLAEYVDVFCDKGFFTINDTERILEAAAKWGMRPKLHVEELASTGGIELGVRYNALSVDHLESMREEQIESLRGSSTMPTALPGTSFFLNMPFAPARKIIDSGMGVALASDYNPGSTPSGDMKFVVSLACIKLRLLPEEAMNAATINSAYAMGLSSDYGSLARGKVANFYITHPLPSVAFIPYAYTTPVISKVFLAGKEIV